MQTPRTRRGEVHPPPFQSFPFFSKTTRQLWTRSIAQREGATREAFFFFFSPFPSATKETLDGILFRSLLRSL
jgi:hypothetical protein